MNLDKNPKGANFLVQACQIVAAVMHNLVLNLSDQFPLKRMQPTCSDCVTTSPKYAYMGA